MYFNSHIMSEDSILDHQKQSTLSTQKKVSYNTFRGNKIRSTNN